MALVASRAFTEGFSRECLVEITVIEDGGDMAPDRGFWPRGSELVENWKEGQKLTAKGELRKP
jgi:hypothetical protein